MAKINFKRGFHRIFLVICSIIILIGGFISWNDAVSNATIKVNFDWNQYETVPQNSFDQFDEKARKTSNIDFQPLPQENTMLPKGFVLDKKPLFVWIFSGFNKT